MSGANFHRNLNQMDTTNSSWDTNRLANRLIGFCAVVGMVSLAQPVIAQPAPFDSASLQIRDSITFLNGSKLTGTIKSESVDSETGRKYVVFESDDKTVMKLDVARLLSKAPEKLNATDLEYNQLVANMADTAEAHREAYRWCEDQSGGKNRYRKQIQFHCERVMELDPNDTAVKHRLDYQYIEEDDRWVPEKLYNDLHGYERKGTSWAPSLRRTVENRKDQANGLESERRIAYRKWKNNLKRMSISQAQNELFRFCDQHSIGFLFEEAKEEKDARVQRMFVEAFGKVQSYAAMEALLFFAIQGDPALADRALDLLRQEHYNASQAAARIAGQYFGSNSNRLLQRAAFAVGELGAENVILPLIGVLVTEHVIAPGEQPGRMKTGFDSNGVSSFSAGGDSKPKKIMVQNSAVVDALKKITDQDYQFSDTAWKQWYIENHTLYDGTLRPARR